MPPVASELDGTIAVTEQDRPAVERIGHLIEGRSARLVGPDNRAIELPEPICQLLERAVHYLLKGYPVSLFPYHQDLTTQQAADVLNVSRQYLVRLLDEARIPYHRTGTHRRVKLTDLLEYRRQRDAKRRERLAGLTRMSQELGLDDDLTEASQ